MTTKIIEGPYFEDLRVGQVLEAPPDVTITAGYVAWHQALFADRLRIPLSQPLSKAVLGSDQPLVHPGLFCNVATSPVAALPSLDRFCRRATTLERVLMVSPTNTGL